MPAAKPNYNRQNRYQWKQSARGAEVGDIPPCKNPARREACRLDLFRFLTTYFPNSTGLKPFGADQLKMITRMQSVMLGGGRTINAIYRGSGKTTQAENTAIWGSFYGHRRFVPIIGATQDAADDNLESIKSEIAGNDLLFEDFPEICLPVRKLEGKPQRCRSQTYKGVLTHIEWSGDKIVLPKIPGSVASEAVISCHGITAAIRGLKHKRSDGRQQRPDMVILDDIQTDEGATSPTSVAKTINKIQRTILKLGGHQSRLAAVMNMTVIAPDDVADQFLNPKLHPEWQGERIKMVKRWADAHETLWQEYKRLRTTYELEHEDDQARAHREATEFYKRNRAEMDRGCIVSWEYCYTTENCNEADVEISAIQHAYNFLFDDGPEAFAAECQNDPLKPHADNNLLTAAEIAGKINGLPRGLVPKGAEYLTAFVDVQNELLYWMVVAWSQNFTGWVIDYGSFPEQVTNSYTLNSITKTLSKATGNITLQGRIAAGLEMLTNGGPDALMNKKYRREDGAEMPINLCMVDAGDETETVKAFCRRSPHVGRIMPSHGQALPANKKAFYQYEKREGDRLGAYWMIPKAKADGTRHVLIDTYHFKTFVHERVKVKLGDKGCLSLFGRRPPYLAGQEKPDHRMLADQWLAEYFVPTQGQGRNVNVWSIKPGNPDNHFFDTIVGCACGASILGCSLLDPLPQRKAPPKRRGATGVVL